MYVPRTPVEGPWPWAGEKMIFIHTPKCGGSFVADAFGLRFGQCPTLMHGVDIIAKRHQTDIKPFNYSFE